MFFKRTPKSKSDAAHVEAAATPAEPLTKPLAPSELRKTVVAAALDLKPAADGRASTALVGQEGAIAAIEAGLAIRAHDFNIFVLGPPGTGKTSVLRALLAKAAAGLPAHDWAYVCNFGDPARPRLIKLPAGRAGPLAEAMAAAVAELGAALSDAFASDDVQARRRVIDEQRRTEQEGAVEALMARAAGQNVALLRTPLGFALGPMHEGRVVKPEVFNQLPQSMRREVEARVAALEQELKAVLSAVPELDRTHRARIAELQEQVADHVWTRTLEKVKAGFADVPEAAAFLDEAHGDFVRNGAKLGAPLESQRVRDGSPLGRYLVRVLAAGEAGNRAAAVEFVSDPVTTALLGDFVRGDGDDASRFHGIRAGALHRANGGFLVIEARDLAAAPGAWEALKRAIEAQEIRAVHDGLSPEPVPLDVKVILVGGEADYARLDQADADFKRLFQVVSEFAGTMARTAESEAAYARQIAGIAARQKAKPLDGSAIALLVEEASRMTGDGEALTLDLAGLAGLVRKSDQASSAAKHTATAREDVARAVRSRAERTPGRGELLSSAPSMDLDGAKVGQVIALTHLARGGSPLARPACVAARVHVGAGGPEGILCQQAFTSDRESARAGAALWSALAGRFLPDAPILLAASLMADLDLDMGAEGGCPAALHYALLSALAEAPLRQDLAVAGSFGPSGELLAVRHVNTRIEAFFEVAAARGLSGTQGVIIPRANVANLMLSEDLVQAVKDDRFAIHAVSSVDDGLALLTGLRTGERRADGAFPAGTVNRLVEDKLRAFAERARQFDARGRAGSPGGNRPS